MSKINIAPLLSASIVELMELWGEFTLALIGHGEHGGGNAVHIRLNRLTYHTLLIGLVAGATADSTAAANALYTACTLFAKMRECNVSIDGWTPEEWISKVNPRLDREYRVKVTRKESLP
jgi:hypothetical protein